MADPPLLGVAWSDRFLSYDFGPGHPFRESSRGLAVELLHGFAEVEPLEMTRIEPLPTATDDALRRFHGARYLREVQDAAAHPEDRYLDQGDTPAFAGCHDAAAALVGGTLAARDAVLEGRCRRGFQPGGGLHHAHPDRASGFCIYNDVAVAIRDALETGRIRRPAYLDVDVHHGDGVMYGFYDDGRLLDIDFHQDGRTIFPGTGDVDETGSGDGRGAKVNLPLPPGAGDAELVTLFDRVAAPLLRAHRPDLIVLQCGTDGHAGDLLGRLQFHLAGYDHVVQGLLEIADETASGRLLVTGGGGYAAEHVARTLACVGRRLAGTASPRFGEGIPAAWRARFAEVTGSASPSTLEAVDPALRPADSPTVDRVVARLENALGRKFRSR